jgi:hypothetical protein
MPLLTLYKPWVAVELRVSFFTYPLDPPSILELQHAFILHSLNLYTLNTTAPDLGLDQVTSLCIDDRYVFVYVTSASTDQILHCVA